MRLERRRLVHGKLVRDQGLIRGIAAGTVHDSGRIAFGPRRRLYISTGDAGRGELAQDPTSLNGKFLVLTTRQYHGRRLADPTVYSTGHRNSQGFAWQPGTGRMYATEHGPTGFDGPEGWDEVNLIRRGGNYGWPSSSVPRSRRRSSPPYGCIPSRSHRPAPPSFADPARLGPATSSSRACAAGSCGGSSCAATR